MSSRLAGVAAAACGILLTMAAPSAAQDAVPTGADTAQDDSGEQRPAATTAAQALEQARQLYGPPPPVEDCPDDDATAISGEIVVCRKRTDNSQFLTQSREASRSDYARRTMDAGDPRAPDVAGAGIFRGPATVGGLCLFPPCPPPPAVFIDVEALPEAPPGSDADRIARGLEPIGDDAPENTPPPGEAVRESALPAAPQ